MVLQVHVRRTSFLFDNTFFEINEYVSPSPGLAFVNVQLVEGVDETTLIKFPTFINVTKEITEMEQFSAYELSVKKDDS